MKVITTEVGWHRDYCYQRGMLVGRLGQKSAIDEIGRIHDIIQAPEGLLLKVERASQQGVINEVKPSDYLPLHRLSPSELFKLPVEWESDYFLIRGGYWLFVLGQEVCLNQEKFLELFPGHQNPRTGGLVAQIHYASGEVDVFSSPWIEGQACPHLIRVKVSPHNVRPSAPGGRTWIDFT